MPIPGRPMPAWFKAVFTSGLFFGLTLSTGSVAVLLDTNPVWLSIAVLCGAVSAIAFLFAAGWVLGGLLDALRGS